MEIVQRATPPIVDELARTYRPEVVFEEDMSGLEALALGCTTVGMGGMYRVLLVIGRTDKGPHRLVKALGPATGGVKLSLPLSGAEDWAWVQDLLAKREAQAVARMKASIERKVEFQRAMDRFLPDEADRQMKQLRGASTFGHGGKLQRIA